MNTCGACRFFGKVHEFNDWPDDADVELTNDSYHVCELLAHINAKNKLPTQPAGVIDGSGYYAALCVSAEFGCNQWQRATDAREGT